MSITTTWIIPGQFMQLTLTGQLTSDDLKALQANLKDVIIKVHEPINFLFDMTHFIPVQTEDNLKQVMQRESVFRSMYIGRVLMVGASEQTRGRMDSLALALHREIHYFSTIDEAFGFYQDDSASLPSRESLIE